MMLSYNCRLNQIAKNRSKDLTRKKRELDALMRLKTDEKRVAVLTREITHLLDNRELTNFLLDAVPFLVRHDALDTLPSEDTYLERCELHEEFLEKFHIKPPGSAKMRDQRQRELHRIRSAKLAVENLTCQTCHSYGTLVDDPVTAATGCTVCATSVSYGFRDNIESLTYEEKTSLGSPPYTYKPEQHFTDLLNQVQGKTRRPIPFDLLAQLQLECRKKGIPKDSISPRMVRLILRDIKRTAYYDEICAITHHLNPKYELICIKEEHQALLKALFREVYSRFPAAKARVNPSRKNFMSYPHLAHVLCDFMGYTWYTKEFTWLKNREKRKAHDEMLRWIFRDIGWEFRNTV